MAQKHTPGPWSFHRTHTCDVDRWYVITDAEGFGPIVDVGGHDRNGQIAEAKYLVTDQEIIEANARRPGTSGSGKARTVSSPTNK